MWCITVLGMRSGEGGGGEETREISRRPKVQPMCNEQASPTTCMSATLIRELHVPAARIRTRSRAGTLLLDQSIQFGGAATIHESQVSNLRQSPYMHISDLLLGTGLKPLVCMLGSFILEIQAGTPGTKHQAPRFFAWVVLF